MRRLIGGWAATLLVVIGVAACGGSGGSSASGAAADPAAKVPAGAVLYASATVQPGADQVKALQHIVNTFGGSGAWNKFLAQLNHSLSTGSVDYDKNIKPWIGNRVGLAFTRWPANLSASASLSQDPADVLLIFPTSHPAQARNAIPALEQKSNANNVTAKVVGNYLLVGGRAAISAAESVPSGKSLADSDAYKAELQKLRANPLATVYLKASSLAPLLNSTANQASATSATSGLDTSAIANALSKLPASASIMAGLSVTNQTIALDVTTRGIKHAQSLSSSVASLPGDSWLAFALPGVSSSEIKQVLSSVEQSNAASGQVTAGQVRAIERVIDTLAPHGIGQISFSIAGSEQTAKAGLSLDLKSTQSADQAAASLYRLFTLGGAHVSGNQSQFSMPAQNFTLRVGTSGTDLVATLGFPSAAAFTSPASKLSDDGTYKNAVSQLPSGSGVPLYMSFTKLFSLLTPQELGATTSPQTLTALRKLSYLIAGSSSGDFRIVLGIH